MHKLSREIKQVLGIWFVASVVGVVLVIYSHQLLPDMLPLAASREAGDINFTLGLFTALAVPVAMLVWVFAGYSLKKWGSREFPDGEGVQIYSNSAIQFSWLAGSAILCLFLVIYGLTLLDNVYMPGAGRNLVVDVTGQQWQWTFRYPAYGNLQTTTLALPAGQPVTFRVTSNDVTHSFWVPALGVKVDANDGEITKAFVTPDRVGTYNVRCAELCGLYHSYMEGPVKVVPPGSFRSWIATKRAGNAA